MLCSHAQSKKQTPIGYLIVLLILLIPSGLALQGQEEPIEISSLTNQVHSRFYVIKRMEKTIQELYHLHTAHQIRIESKILAYLQAMEPFKNETINKCVHDLIQKKSLQPLFACWQKIITYKYIDNPRLILEFSELIYRLLRQLIHTTKIPLSKPLKLFISREIEDTPANTHLVSFRFYLLKRLTKSHAILEKYHDLELQSIPANMIFIHAHTADCYATLQKNRSLAPIQNLLTELHEYRFINDTLFVQEFLQLLFIAHACIAQTLSSNSEPTHSFEHIASLSITELLETIDIEIRKQDHKQYTIPLMLEENFDFSPNQFAQYVYRRFYFIERLERIMNLFKGIDHSIHDLSCNHYNPHDPFAQTGDIYLNASTMFDFKNSFSFKHSLIQESIRTMEHEHNLKPLFAVWDDFSTYKSIEDQLFVEEFTKEIFVISRNMLICSGICTIYPLDRSTVGLSVQQLLDVIDLYTEQFLEHKPEYSSAHLEAAIKPIRMPDLQPSVHIDDVVLRYYHVQRLGIIFWLLNEIHAKAIPLHIKYALTPKGLLLNSQYLFNHEHIVSIIKIMEQTNSIEPLMGLLQGVQRYKYIDDELFTREYLTLTLITLQHLQLKQRPFFGIRGNIEEVPLEKILEAIDLIAQELPALLEKYEFNSSMAWKEWFKKYWWAPAIVLGTIGIKVNLILQNRPLPITPPVTVKQEDTPASPLPTHQNSVNSEKITSQRPNSGQKSHL